MQLIRYAGGSRSDSRRAARLAAVVAGLVLVPLAAQARPNTQAMSCTQAQALVRSKGAVVLDTSATTYDRYVTDLAYCSGGEQLQPEWVATRDVAKCFIGYTCFVPDRDQWTR